MKSGRSSGVCTVNVLVLLSILFSNLVTCVCSCDDVAQSVDFFVVFVGYGVGVTDFFRVEFVGEVQVFSLLVHLGVDAVYALRHCVGCHGAHSPGGVRCVHLVRDSLWVLGARGRGGGLVFAALDAPGFDEWWRLWEWSGRLLCCLW